MTKFIFRQKQKRITEKEKLTETMRTKFKTCYRSTVSKTVWHWCAHACGHTKAIISGREGAIEKVDIRTMFLKKREAL